MNNQIDELMLSYTTLGVGYKRHFSKGAIRAKISFLKHKIHSHADKTFFFQQGNVSIGYERHINFSKSLIF
jgi:hypothetical protein